MENNIYKVATAIIWQDNKVLACRCLSDNPSGLWEFPCGNIADGENALIACKRGVLEKLGSCVSTAWLLQTMRCTYSDQDIEMQCFVCMLLPRQDLKSQEQFELRWLERSELLDVEWLDANAEVARLLGTQWDQVFMSQHF